MRGTAQSCLSFLADRTASIQVCEFVRMAEQWMNSLNQPPNFVVAKAPGFFGKPVSYARAKNMLQELSMEEAHYVTLLAMPPRDENFFDAPVSASINVRREVLLSLDTSIKLCENDWLAIAKQIHCAMPFVYGYQYVLPYSVGPGMYAAGIVHSISAAVEGHEEELRTRWMHLRLAHEKKTYSQIIRQVYPLQFLSDAHLRLRVGDLTLRAWIEATRKRGRLCALLPGVWTWSVPNRAAVQAANMELFNAGILSAWDPQLAQSA